MNLNSIKNDFIDIVQKYKTWIILLGIGILYYSFTHQGTNPMVMMPSFSFLGGTGGTIVFLGSILLVIAIALVFVPGINIIVAPMFALSAYLLAGGIVINAIENLLSSISGIAIIALILFVLWMFIPKAKRLILRR